MAPAYGPFRQIGPVPFTLFVHNGAAMVANKYILALDQGTTSSRAIIVQRDGCIVAAAQEEFPQILPTPGIVEHDPEAIWTSQHAVALQAMASAGLYADDIAAIGLTNQRETTVLWDRDTGRPAANAVVWQSRASAGVCDRLKADGLEPLIRAKTGLLIDAYFSAGKIKHLFDTREGLRDRAERGEILFGTVDTWLLWRLTGGKRHATDYSNASRTSIFNIHTLDWDDELLAVFDIPRAMLPDVCSSSEFFGETSPELFGRPIPITGIAGDQQAATFGQACFQTGSVKNTYGTGCFMLMNTGEKPVASENNLLTTIGWVLDGKVTYCLEGSIFIAGAVVHWLRDGLGIIKNSADVARLAGSVADCDGVYLVPAFVGLGAPYWDPYARGLIIGITRGTTAAHIARAAVESMAYQTCDVLRAMQKDAAAQLPELKVDGGASINDLLMQFQADLLGVRVRRPKIAETTALGAAYLAGLAVGYWHDQADVTRLWALDREFQPQMPAQLREKLYQRWQEAVSRSLNWAR
jgi:glycerol kinase